jgi:ubiquinone/menaquinone biosynthesis C-methylase UbiE
MNHSAPNQAFVDRLFELGARGSMLDVGTGPGHIPLLVCERDATARVLGVDLAQHMLDFAERHRRASPHADRIGYRIADAKSLDFGDGAYDVVYSNTILHHIPDPLPFLAEAHRVMRPGGVLLIRDLFRPETAARVDEIVELYAGDCTSAQRELFRASLHAALEPDELREMAAAAGMNGAEVVIDSDRHMSLQIRAKE